MKSYITQGFECYIVVINRKKKYKSNIYIFDIKNI